MNKTPGQPRYFPSVDSWRRWLETHHAKSAGLWVILFKKHLNQGLSYTSAVEEALCFGWIDGQLRRIDDRSHMLRFTPRRARSIWAPSNIVRVKRLIREKRMTPAGLQIYRARQVTKSLAPVVATPTALRMPIDLRRALQIRKFPYQRFLSLPPSHRTRILWWVQSAKKAETRARRIRNVVSNLTRYRRPHW